MEKDILISKIEDWCVSLTEQDEKNWKPELIPLFSKRFGYDLNSKYIRVWYISGSQKSVWAFVDYDGNIYKPAGWKAPYKSVRGNIENPPMVYRDLYARG